MNLTKKMIVVCAAWHLVSMGVYADNSYAYDDNAEKRELIVTVPAGETNVMDATYLVATVTNFVKRGFGCLDVDSDISAGTFTISVEEGTYKASAAKSLGRNSGKIIVKNGATLWNAKGANDYSGKVCEVAGFGFNGSGALRESSWPVSSYPFGRSIFLKGDTLCVMTTAYLHQGTIIDMGGYDFHIQGAVDSNNLRMLNVTFNNPGRIFSGLGIVTFGWAMNLGGDASNVYHVENGWFDIQSVTTSPTWTLELGIGSGISCFSGGRDTTENTWAGPVLLNNNRPVDVDAVKHVNSVAEHEVGIGFSGKVSGSGFRLVGRGGDNWRMPHLHLMGDANDFTNGVCGSWGCLDVYCNGALPADGTPVALTNSSCVFHSGREGLDLPRAIFSGSGKVSRGFGTWRDSLTKVGEGSLDYDSNIGSDVLDIQGGAVCISVSNVHNRAYAGLLTGVRFAGKTNSEVKNCIMDDETFTNDVATGTELLYTGCGPDWLGTNRCVCYSGYIWNRESTNVTWTFAGGMLNGYRLAIDGVTLIEQYWGDDTADIRIANVTLSPGPHEFLYKSAVTDYTGWEQGPTIANVGDRGVYRSSYQGELYENWVAAFGLAVDRSGRGTRDYRNYEKLLDGGDGLLFTVCRPGIDELPEVPSSASVSPLRFGKVVFGADAQMNLDGSDWTFDDVTGVPLVGNAGTVTINGTWLVPAAELGTKTFVHSGRVVFGAQSMFAVDGDERLKKARHASPVTLITADGGIDGLPQNTPNSRWMLSVSDDGKSLVAKYIHDGMIIMIQ